MSRPLRDALGCFATGVTVVTTHMDGVDYGMTCSSFSSVSLEPPLVLWSLQRHASTADAYRRAEGYSISVLSAEQGDLAMRFATAPPEQRFNNIPLERSPAGRVLLPGCVAWFDCTLQQVIPAGDHDILLGHVMCFQTNSGSGQGLIFERSRFGYMQQVAA